VAVAHSADARVCLVRVADGHVLRVFTLDYCALAVACSAHGELVVSCPTYVYLLSADLDFSRRYKHSLRLSLAYAPSSTGELFRHSKDGKYVHVFA
jgi:hypothetical protein